MICRFEVSERFETFSLVAHDKHRHAVFAGLLRVFTTLHHNLRPDYRLHAACEFLGKWQHLQLVCICMLGNMSFNTDVWHACVHATAFDEPVWPAGGESPLPKQKILDGTLGLPCKTHAQPACCLLHRMLCGCAHARVHNYAHAHAHAHAQAYNWAAAWESQHTCQAIWNYIKITCMLI